MDTQLEPREVPFVQIVPSQTDPFSQPFVTQLRRGGITKNPDIRPHSKRLYLLPHFTAEISIETGFSLERFESKIAKWQVEPRSSYSP